MYCMECGAQIAAEAKFCDKCGTKVDAGPTDGNVASSVPQNIPTPKQKARPSLIIIWGGGFIGLCILAGVVGNLYFALTGRTESGNKPVANQQPNEQEREAEEEATAKAKFARTKGGIGLHCTYSDGSGSIVLIYSDAQNIQLMGPFKNGAWEVEDSLKKIAENNIEITFEVVNEIVERINPGSGLSGQLTINRETLNAREITNLRGGANLTTVSDYNCTMLDDNEYAELVKDVINARESQKSRNKL